MKKNQKKVVCVRLNESVINEINKVCEDLEIDFSDFIRGAINYSLKCRAKKQKSKGGGFSTGGEDYFNNFYDNYMKENAEEIAKNDERIQKILKSKGGDL